MFSEILQATGGIMSVKWVHDGHVTTGAFCTSQGVLKQVGDVGNALATLAIAVHTFSIIVFKWSPPSSPRLALFILAGIWTFLLIIVATNASINRKKDYYGDTDLWCWITEDFPVQRIALEYFWMWFTSLLNIVLYCILALVIKGFVVFNGWHMRFPSKEERQQVGLRDLPGCKTTDNLAIQMLFYPAVYTICVLPIAIARWSTFYGGDIPLWATVVADCIFAASGLFNVILFALTRPTLVPKRSRAHSRTHSRTFNITPFTSVSSPVPPPPSCLDPTHGRARAHFFDPPTAPSVSISGRTRTSASSDVDEWEVAPRSSPIDKYPLYEHRTSRSSDYTSDHPV
jgi:hypothetical protein